MDSNGDSRNSGSIDRAILLAKSTPALGASGAATDALRTVVQVWQLITGSPFCLVHFSAWPTMRQLKADRGDDDEDRIADFCVVSRRTLDEFELELEIATALCRHCRSVNLIPGLSGVGVFVCNTCGKPSSNSPVRESSAGAVPSV